MSYDVCVFGDLQFLDGVESWKARPLDGRPFPDWPEAYRWSAALDLDDNDATVGAWFGDLKSYERRGKASFLEVQEDPAHVSIRGIVTDESYDRYRRSLATAFRLASHHGAHGSLTFVSPPGQPFTLGYRIDVGGGRSTVRAVDEDEAQKLPDYALVFEILSRVDVPVAAATMTPAAG